MAAGEIVGTLDGEVFFGCSAEGEGDGSRGGSKATMLALIHPSTFVAGWRT